MTGPMSRTALVVGVLRAFLLMLIGGSTHGPDARQGMSAGRRRREPASWFMLTIRQPQAVEDVGDDDAHGEPGEDVDNGGYGHSNLLMRLIAAVEECPTVMAEPARENSPRLPRSRHIRGQQAREGTPPNVG